MRLPRRARSLALLLACWSAAAGGAAAQSKSESKEYQDAVRLGLEEFERGNYAEMYAAMRRAHAIDPNARTERGIGQAAFELKRYAEALVHLRAALQSNKKPLTAKQRQEVEALIVEAKTYVGRVRVALIPEGAQLRVDQGSAIKDEDGALLLSIGEHSFEAAQKGYRTAQARVQVLGGDEQTVTLELEPDAALAIASENSSANAGQLTQPREPPTEASDTAARPGLLSRWWFWTAVGVVVAAGATTAVLVATRGTTTQAAIPGDVGAKGVVATLRTAP